MMTKKAGRYLARVMDWTAGTSKGGTPQVALRFDLLSIWTGEEWEEVQDQQITAFLYPIKTNGSVNEIAVNALKDCFSWDGRFAFFSEREPTEKYKAQLTIEHEEYNGESHLKVKWLNPFNSDPRGSGLAKADASFIKSLDAQYGSVFRAAGITGSKPAAGPRPAAAAGTTPADIAKGSAWSGFKIARAGSDPLQHAVEFRRAVEDYFEDRSPTLITADEWKRFESDGFRKAVTSPIGDEPHFAPDDIPF